MILSIDNDAFCHHHIASLSRKELKAFNFYFLEFRYSFFYWNILKRLLPLLDLSWNCFSLCSTSKSSGSITSVSSVSTSAISSPCLINRFVGQRLTHVTLSPHDEVKVATIYRPVIFYVTVEDTICSLLWIQSLLVQYIHDLNPLDTGNCCDDNVHVGHYGYFS